MDVVEGQSLQLHIGRLGEGGCAAQMGWLGNSYMSGNVVGETRRGVRRRCSVILQSMDKQKVARQRKEETSSPPVAPPGLASPGRLAGSHTGWQRSKLQRAEPGREERQ